MFNFISRVLAAALGFTLAMALMMLGASYAEGAEPDPIQLGDYWCDLNVMQMSFLGKDQMRHASGAKYAIDFCLEHGPKHNAPCLLSVKEITKGSLDIKCTESLGNALIVPDAKVKEKPNGKAT